MHELRRLFIILAAQHTRLLPYKTFRRGRERAHTHTHSLFGFVMEWQRANGGPRSGCNANRRAGKDETVFCDTLTGRAGWGGKNNFPSLSRWLAVGQFQPENATELGTNWGEDGANGTKRENNLYIYIFFFLFWQMLTHNWNNAVKGTWKK